MKFTILGASGFIGRRLASQLTENGHEVARPSRQGLKSLADSDLGHVFYCIGMDDIRRDLRNAVDAHAGCLANILTCNNFASLTYLSTTRLYLGAQNADEEATIQISSNDDNAIFSVMKMAGEQLCFAFNRPTVRVVRLSSVLGFAPNGVSLIPALITSALRRGQIQPTISPNSARDYIAIEDIVAVLPRIALEGKQRCYNIASGMNISLAEIVRIIGSQIPSTCHWQPDAPTVIFPVIDTGRIRAEFSFAPRPVLDALASTCIEFRARLRLPLET